ncbi:hypothetical protein LTR56_004991 [Elasticomyces elasticus]|nr:hypothetical protein LTR22_015806 [Elasticomyces elasticus]KAK3652697.1 hypothetical protein LTR56_004991 [Elasticomyces elasticus]KAK4914627.1 hypothetical protein LTR49_017194 [Elasticomyces elasticus]KAK5753993.1 hypothetical protein LTS12_015959 [Elasticomyces elasticus]
MSSSLLSTHLTQISSSSSFIASLSFPQPKIFTNALLHTSDITALIRDTEAHERALFHLAPPPLPSKTADFTGSVTTAPAPTARRATGARQPKSKAVAAVLGGDLYRKTRRAEDVGGNKQGGIDVEVLLEGAEKLGGVYPIPGAADKIAGLRERHRELVGNIAHYEDRVARNAQELQLMNRPSSRGGYRDDEDVAGGTMEVVEGPTMTREDLRREEEEVRELERKKRGLEERVSGMERDLGGLAR